MKFKYVATYCPFGNKNQLTTWVYSRSASSENGELEVQETSVVSFA